MATAQLLKITHGVDDKVEGVDDKVKDIGDTVKLVLDGARCVIFSFVNVYMARWKRNKSNCATNSKRSDSNYATYGEQRWRSKEFVVP